VIDAGQVEVVRDEKLVITLSPGDYFGEQALAVGGSELGRRSATVRTRTRTTLLALHVQR
jgi:CRP-like cAMP-binding protein